MLELGDRTLHDALTHERVAGHDFFLVRKMATDLARALHHLHENGRIHADFKPLNAVRVESTWQLIDLDISCELGSALGSKVPSSGYCPPELAKALLEATDERKHCVDPGKLASGYGGASIAYDLWSFGAVLFHLVTGQQLWLTNHSDDLNPDDLVKLAAWPVDISSRWQQAVSHPTLDQAVAFDLLRSLLQPDPRVRLQHFGGKSEASAMLRVLDHPFFGHSAQRSIKCVATSEPFQCKSLHDQQAYHLFLSHAWPAAQDRVRIIKERLAECVPSCRTFLDVDDLVTGSGTTEVDKSECILVFCTRSYFAKRNAMKELYRAVVQRRPILAILEPDASQDGGLNQAAIEALITEELLNQHGLGVKWDEWMEGNKWVSASGLRRASASEVRAALFRLPPVEWHRLPQLQDVTIRLIVQRGIAFSRQRLYLEGEAASPSWQQVDVLPLDPSSGRTHHVFCSEFNAGAAEVLNELAASGVISGKQPLLFTSDFAQLRTCTHMLVLLDARTWTSEEDSFQLGLHVEEAFRSGVHLCCAHEAPSLLGPPRSASEFSLIFDATPDHLCGRDGPANLYREIATTLLSDEWRKPGLAALASKLAETPPERQPQACEAKMASWREMQGARTNGALGGVASAANAVAQQVLGVPAFA